MIREDILQRFPDLFGTKKVNGRDVNIEQAIVTLTRELGPEIAAALTGRRALLQSSAMGKRVYESLGFATVETWTRWTTG